MRRFALLVVASLVALVISTGVAAAHAKLLSIEPANGATIERPPATIVLVYSEVVQNKGAQVTVTAPSGARVDQGTPRTLDATVTQPLGPMTEVGVYKVVARVVSADGHPVTDEATFTVRTASSVTPAPPPVAPNPPAQRSNSSGAVVAAVGLLTVVLVALGIAVVRRRGTPSDT